MRLHVPAVYETGTNSHANTQEKYRVTAALGELWNKHVNTALTEKLKDYQLDRPVTTPPPNGGAAQSRTAPRSVSSISGGSSVGSVGRKRKREEANKGEGEQNGEQNGDLHSADSVALDLAVEELKTAIISANSGNESKLDALMVLLEKVVSTCVSANSENESKLDALIENDSKLDALVVLLEKVVGTSATQPGKKAKKKKADLLDFSLPSILKQLTNVLDSVQAIDSPSDDISNALSKELKGLNSKLEKLIKNGPCKCKAESDLDAITSSITDLVSAKVASALKAELSALPQLLQYIKSRPQIVSQIPDTRLQQHHPIIVQGGPSLIPYRQPAYITNGVTNFSQSPHNEVPNGFQAGQNSFQNGQHAFQNGQNAFQNGQNAFQNGQSGQQNYLQQIEFST